MRKTFLILSALALVGFASCQKPENQNPDYNAETDEVLTNFVLSVSTGSNAQTKMTPSTVQKDNTFRGMEEVRLFTFANGNTSGDVYVINPDVSATREYDLGTLLASGAINSATNQTASSNRILQLSIPTGTDAVLFYGKAINPNQETNSTTLGHTVASISTTPSKTHFDIKRRIGSDSEVEKYDATARLMIYIINRIIDASVAKMTATDDPYMGYTGLPALAWKELGHQYERNLLNIPKTIVTGYTEDATPDPIFAGATPDERAESADVYNNLRDDLKECPNYRTLYPLEEVMGRLYYLFTHFNEDDASTTDVNETEKYRAGSSRAVLAMVSSMESQITRSANTDPTGPEEANAKRLASRISAVMQVYFTKDLDGNWEYKDIQTIKGNLTDAVWSSERFEGARDINNYPQSFHIPEGAAQLAFTHTGVTIQGQDIAADHFYYLHPNDALVTPGATFDPKKYVYPAELYYYVNSGLRVTDKEVSTSDYPNGVDPWLTGGTDNKWSTGQWLTNGKVQSSTRGVAVRDNIQYGVALLKTSVKWGKNIATTNDQEAIQDNRAKHTSNEGNNSILLKDVNIELKGILIGGVNPRYDWQFLPVDASNEVDAYGIFDGVIYDDAIVSGAFPTAENQETYTLVYDNYDWTGTQRDVYVTLEFVNHGDPFWGRDNIIPKEGTFYLVGQLKADGSYATEISDWDAKWNTFNKYAQMPPVYLTGDTLPEGASYGKSKKVARVFMQNVMTSATFRIGKTSLQSAYYAIPDLKSAQMSLGLSVDISWQDGYEYDLEFGIN